jgi:hypothetical protein
MTSHEDWASLVQGLISTAAERAKHFLLNNIVGMKPRGSVGASNAVVRRQHLVEYAEYIVFLQEYAPAAHKVVVQRYCEDNGEYLLATVRAYTTGLFSAVDKRSKPTLVTASESGARLTGLFVGGASAVLGSHRTGSEFGRQEHRMGILRYASVVAVRVA